MMRSHGVLARIKAAVVVVAVLVGMGVAAPVGAAVSVGVRFVQPGVDQLRGLVDLEVVAASDATAVRFFMDGVQLSELTDVYAKQTGSAPVWKTATDAGWFVPGRHVLRAEADTPRGVEVAEKGVVTHRAEPAEGVVSLTGGWSFASAEELPAGAAEGVRPAAAQPGFGFSDWATVMVPNSLGAVAQRYNDKIFTKDGAEYNDGVLGVYRRVVDVDKPVEGESVSVVFESCYWHCRVFWNGVEVGGMTGGYLPTRVDVSDVVEPGRNHLAVIVDHRLSEASPVSQIHRRDHYYYWNWGGLLQEVRLERSPSLALVDLRAEGTMAGRLTLRPAGLNGAGVARSVEALAEVIGPDGVRVLGPQRVSTVVPAGGGQAEPIVMSVPRPRLWDLDHPVLYTVRLTPIGSARSRTLVERTGFRDVRAVGSDVRVNGEVVSNLQGFNRHADYPGLGRTQPAGLAYRELKELRDRGFRVFRPAHYPTTPGQLDAADELGLLVIEEVNVSGQTGALLSEPSVREFGRSQLVRMIERDRSHPSIIAWSVGSENRGDQAGGPEYARDTIAAGKALDPTRLYTQVTAQQTNDRSLQYQDIIAHNWYAGWYTSEIRDVVDLLDRVQAYAGNKPIYLSEYGAEAPMGRDGTEKGSEYFQAKLVDEHNRLLNGRKHLFSKNYWTSTEFWCRPDWAGGDHADPVPPFHTKGLRNYYRTHDKLAWRVMFAPVRLSASVVERPVGHAGPVTQRVVVRDVRPAGAEGAVEGTLMVQPPPGMSVQPSEQSFRVPAGGEAVVTVTLSGSMPANADSATGRIRAVIDADTETLPLLFDVRHADLQDHPATDGFDGQQLDPGWSIVRDEPSGRSLTDRPGWLRLSALPGSEEGAANDGRNLLLRDATPAGEFTAATRVDAAGLSQPGQEAGLHLYGSDDDFVKVTLGKAAAGGSVVRFVSERNGSAEIDEAVPIDVQVADLRLVRRDEAVAAEYSVDGSHWFVVGEAAAPAGARLGLQATGRDATGAGSADLAGLTVRAPKLAVERISAEQPMIGGRENTVEISVRNWTDQPVTVTGRVDVPDGWTSGEATQSLEPLGATTIQVPVTPGQEPTIDTIAANVTSEEVPVYGATTAEVITAPAGEMAALAVDAGTTSSPLFDGYQRLSPATLWEETRGFGWVGTPPDSRDRAGLDALRRDFTLSLADTTLRIAVPAGAHRGYLLAGDRSFTAGRTIVSAGGQTLADTGRGLARGEFMWLGFNLDGGPTGRQVDLHLSSARNSNWRLNALVLLDQRKPEQPMTAYGGGPR